MKTYRPAFRIINIVAAFLASASVFWPWLDSFAAYSIDFIRLVSPQVLDPAESIFLSIAIVIFVGAFLTLIGGIFASKYLVVIGWLIDAAVLGAWLGMTIGNLGGDFTIGRLQAGVWVMGASIILTFVSLFLRTKKRYDFAEDGASKNEKTQPKVVEESDED